jgi:hypothetical protein
LSIVSNPREGVCLSNESTALNERLVEVNACWLLVTRVIDAFIVIGAVLLAGRHFVVVF